MPVVGLEPTLVDNDLWVDLRADMRSAIDPNGMYVSAWWVVCGHEGEQRLGNARDATDPIAERKPIVKILWWYFGFA